MFCVWDVHISSQLAANTSCHVVTLSYINYTVRVMMEVKLPAPPTPHLLHPVAATFVCMCVCTCVLQR